MGHFIILFKLGPLKFHTRAPRTRETQHHRGRDKRTLKPIASQNYHQEQDQEIDIHFIQERQLKLWKYECPNYKDQVLMGNKRYKYH